MARFSFHFTISLLSHLICSFILESFSPLNNYISPINFLATPSSHVQSNEYLSCQTINHFENGRVKYSYDEREVKFYCFKSFVLVGDQSATCILGNWTASPPVCAKTNCPSLPRLLHGTTKSTHKGGVIYFECDSQFILQGSSKLVCFKNGWNGSIPTCQAESLPLQEVCHFEPDTFKIYTSCNWIPKPALYKWVVTPSKSLSSEDGKGKQPLFDHTLAPHTGGYYLYLQNAMAVSRNFLKNEKRLDSSAKYISPMFPAIPVDEDWCLIFWLYANHPQTTVKVLVNYETRWDNNGYESNRWRKVIVSLTQQTTPFQIVIEGKGHLGSSSNTAIDDLYLTNGTDCHDTTNVEDPYTVEPEDFSDEYDDETKATAKGITNPRRQSSHLSTQSSSLVHTDYSTTSTTAIEQNVNDFNTAVFHRLETSSTMSSYHPIRQQTDVLDNNQSTTLRNSETTKMIIDFSSRKVSNDSTVANEYLSTISNILSIHSIENLETTVFDATSPATRSTIKLQTFPKTEHQPKIENNNTSQDEIKPAATQSGTYLQVTVAYLTVVILCFIAITTVYILWKKFSELNPSIKRNKLENCKSQNELVLQEIENNK